MMERWQLVCALGVALFLLLLVAGDDEGIDE